MEHYLTSVGVEAKEVKLVSLDSVFTELVVIQVETTRESSALILINIKCSPIRQWLEF